MPREATKPASAGLLDYASAPMSLHVYHEIFLHLNWHTKQNRALLRGRVETVTHETLRAKCRAFKGAYLHGLGGTDDHVHLAVSIEPFVCISELVQQLKGASSHDVNQRLEQKVLEWQRGYGVVSFGRRNLKWVLGYLARQREHHANGSLHTRLEMCALEGPVPGTEKPG